MSEHLKLVFALAGSIRSHDVPRDFMQAISFESHRSALINRKQNYFKKGGNMLGYWYTRNRYDRIKPQL